VQRRDLFKLTGIGIAATAASALTGCSTTTNSQTMAMSNTQSLKETMFKDKKRKRVVIVGGGISGLSVAGSIRATDTDKSIEIIVLEKNKRFHACPGSNILLTKTASEYANEIGAPAEWIFNYHKVKEDFMKNDDILITDCEVIGGDTKHKILQTTKGNIAYDTLILCTGVAYDYEAQFPKWDKTKIEKAKLLTPGAMIGDGGDEWTNMSNRWEDLLKKAKNNPNKQFNLVISPTPKTSKKGTKTLRRCPPAAGERTSTLASRIKKEGIKNLKIHFLIELDTSLGSKHAAFKQSWEKLGYCQDISDPTQDDIIQPMFKARIDDIDFDKKLITYTQNILDEEQLNIEYDEAIIMPYQKTPDIVKKVFNTKSEVKLIKNGFEVEGLSNHYILGDSQSTHPIPASGSMAMSISGILSNRVINQLKGKDKKEDYTVATNVCYSMVGEDPNRGIKVMHTFYTKEGLLKGKGTVPKKDEIYMSNDIVLEQGGWLFGIGGLFFATGKKEETQLNK